MEQDLKARVAYLEWRLGELERRLAQPISPEPPAAVDLETAVGLTWLNRVGAALVIAGLALGAAWANRHGYLSAHQRNALLAVASVLVTAVGVRMLGARDAWRRGFALGIAAVGTAGLYLVPLSAARIDGIVEPGRAVLLGAILTVGLVVAGGLKRLPALSSLALLGGLSLPVVGDSFGLACAGLGLVGGLYVVEACRRRPLSIADHAAIIVATGGAIAVLSWQQASAQAPGVVGVALAVGCAAVALTRGPSAARELLFALAAFALGVAWCATVFAAGGWLAVTAGLVAYGLALVGYGVSRADRVPRLLGVAALGLAAAKLLGHDLWHFDLGVRVAGLFVLGLGLLAGSFLYTRVVRST